MKDSDYARALINPPELPPRPAGAMEAAAILAAEIERRIQHAKPLPSAPWAWQFLRVYYYRGGLRAAPRLPWSTVLEAQRIVWGRFDHLGPTRAPAPSTMIRAALALRVEARQRFSQDRHLITPKEAWQFLRASQSIGWEAARIVQREFWGSVEWRVLRQRARTPAQRAAHARRLLRAISEGEGP